MTGNRKEMIVYKDGKQLRRGFTTGSCAAAAASAAAYMLCTGDIISEVKIHMPDGTEFQTQVIPVENGRPLFYTCEVIKDAGDDPDCTDGVHVRAKVTALRDKVTALRDKANLVEKENIGNMKAIDEADKAPNMKAIGEADNAAINRSVFEEDRVLIKGGPGVGIVTKPGLDQPVGEAAINRIPRKMIRENVSRVLDDYIRTPVKESLQDDSVLTPVKESGTDGCIVPPQQLLVEISVPGGEELAKKTFNPKLGIVGGISILGTTGIVEPMSEQAVVETIRAQIRMKRAMGAKGVVAAPGNYGLQFLEERYGVLPDDVVMISNFVRDAAQMAGAEGMTSFLLAGHIGKLVKVAGGIGNTHSRYGDHRMEILWEIAEEVRREMRPDQRDAQMPQEQLMEETAWEALRQSVMECVTTDAALALLAQCGRGFCDQVAIRLAARIQKYLKEWGGEAMRVEVIVFAGQREELVRTPGAAELL